MDRKKLYVAAPLVVLIAGAVWLQQRSDPAEGTQYRFATVERGNLEAAVSATGTLGAVTTVQVGTQVSGQVAAIYVDFNDRVRKGQLLARIDPTLAEQAVQEAQANLARNQAELEQAERDFQRNNQLFESKVITESEFNTVQYRLAVARANVRSAIVSVDRARRNLAYTQIYAPIDGIVVERNVDVGQTVAASLSAPQLFLIANDLSHMQILASVDESDIGQIRDGQPVRFTVQAYPNETFTGAVRQVRLQSATQENVVSYTAVISVENPNGKLLPGMTATVEFLTGNASDVLLVPNAALRFRPTPEMLAQLDTSDRAGGDTGGARNGQRGPTNGSTGRSREGSATASPAGFGGSGSSGGGSSRAGRRNFATLWYLDEKGNPAVARVRTGLTDGQRTEVQGPELKEGMQVIVGVTQTEATGAASPFQQPQQQTGGRPRPGGF